MPTTGAFAHLAQAHTFLSRLSQPTSKRLRVDAQGAGGRTNTAMLLERRDGGRRREFGPWPAQAGATFHRRLEAGDNPLANRLPFHLGERRCDREETPAHDRRRVERLSHTHKLDTASVEILDIGERLPSVAKRPVEPHNGDHVHPPRPAIRLEALPLRPATGHGRDVLRVLVDNLVAGVGRPGPQQVKLRL